MALPSDIEWANKYYDEPDVVRYAGLIHLLSRARRTLQDGEHTGRLLGVAVRCQPERLRDAWREHLQHIVHPEFQRMIVFALWYSNVPEARDLMRTFTHRGGGGRRRAPAAATQQVSTLMRLRARALLQGERPEEPIAKPLKGGEEIVEELWDNFLMSGDKKFLERMGIAAAYRSPEKAAAGYKSTWEEHGVEVDQETADCAAYKLFTMSYNHKPVADVFQGLYMRAREGGGGDDDAEPREGVLRGTATVAEEIPGMG